MQYHTLLMPHQDKPFNGDTFIQQEFLKLREKFNLNAVVETGTCLGSTTKWFAENFYQVYTIEVNAEFRNFAVKVFAEQNNIISILGDSSKDLPSVVKGLNDDTIFFLDAHWGNHCPLQQELDAIAEAIPPIKPVIAIHDFVVPGHPELGFDSINGQPFTFEWLKPYFDKIYGGEGNYDHYYNSDATEIKRGIIYVTPKQNGEQKQTKEETAE